MYMKTQKIMSVILGGLLLIIGISFLFDTLSVSPKQWILPALGLILLAYGVKSKNKIVLSLGLAGTLFGVSGVIAYLILPYQFHLSLYFGASAVLLFIFAYAYKNGWFGVLGILSSAIGIFKLLACLDISSNLREAYLLICIATILVVFFMVSYEKFGYLPLISGILCYLLSVPKFLENARYINSNLSDVISACLLILAGVVLVFKVYKSGTKENKSE